MLRMENPFSIRDNGLGKDNAMYCKCKYCYYLDTHTRDSYKCYCEWYRMFVDPDEAHECSHYRD